MVVVINIIRNHLNQRISTGKAFPIISFSLKNSPKAFHRTVINAFGNTRHALYHTGFYYLLVKIPAGVLEPSVAVKNWMGFRIRLNRFVESIIYQLIIIAVPDLKSRNPTVV